jgi:hypothetical protein
LGDTRSHGDNERTGNGKDKYRGLSTAAAKYAAFGRDDVCVWFERTVTARATGNRNDNSSDNSSGNDNDNRRFLRVVAQQVIPIQARSADGGVMFEAGMWSVPVIGVEPLGEHAVSMF